MLKGFPQLLVQSVFGAIPRIISFSRLRSKVLNSRIFFRICLWIFLEEPFAIFRLFEYEGRKTKEKCFESSSSGFSSNLIFSIDLFFGNIDWLGHQIKVQNLRFSLNLFFTIRSCFVFETLVMVLEADVLV